MACKICKRGSCTESFHSSAEQEKYEQRTLMSDDVDTLRREIQDLKEELAEANRIISDQENRIEELKCDLVIAKD